MSSSAKQTCATCRKSGDVFICRGCRQSFCERHIDEHRDHLSKELNRLADDYELLRRDIDREEDAQSLLSVVNTWEHESIAKVCLATENVRGELTKWIERNQQVKGSYDQVITELRTSQKSEDYNETDLKRWTKLLDEFREKAEPLPNVDAADDDDTIHLLKIQENLDQSHYSRSTESTPSITHSTLDFHEMSQTLVRERFDNTVGGATLLDDGLVAAYSGVWLGQTSICGINHYSSGTHHIRFRIVEKFYDSPFFGIITASQKNCTHVLDSISTNGWLNFEYPIQNGTKESRIGRDKLIQALDDVTLILDCERRQLFLKHHRSKRLLHLPIDLRACPFPWKMLVVLHRRGDCVRIVGGTLSLTRENLSSRLSERPAH